MNSVTWYHVEVELSGKFDIALLFLLHLASIVIAAV